jgi:hypothetical protein
MPFVTEQLLAESDSMVTVRFTSRNGKSIVRTYNKIAGMSTEDLLNVLHQRMVLKYVEGAQKANRFQRTILEENDDSITIKFDSRAV